jgi:hypothetical protein
MPNRFRYYPHALLFEGYFLFESIAIDSTVQDACRSHGLCGDSGRWQLEEEVIGQV